MKDHDSISRDLDQLRSLMDARLGLRTRSFERAVRKAGRRLPKRLRGQAKLLVGAAQLAEHPKLRLTLDQGAIEAAMFEIRSHLETISLSEQRKSWWLGWLGTNAFNLLMIFAAVIAVLLWRGLV